MWIEIGLNREQRDEEPLGDVMSVLRLFDERAWIRMTDQGAEWTMPEVTPKGTRFGLQV